MKIFILINAIVEILAGLVMFLFPNKLPTPEGMTPRAGTLASMYGAAALAIGFFALQVWRSYPNADLVYTLLLMLVIFHAGVMTAAYRGVRSGLKDVLPVAILHAALALGSLYFFTQMA